MLDGIAGPVHLNLAFREPLSAPVTLPDVEPGRLGAARRAPARPSSCARIRAPSSSRDRAPASRRRRPPARSGAPLLAEVASGARFGPNLVAAYRELLVTGNFGDRVERVVVFGHPTLSREVPALIERPGVETIVVRSPGIDDYNPGHRVQTFADAVTIADDPAGVEAERSWVGRWVAVSRERARAGGAARRRPHRRLRRARRLRARRSSRELRAP